MANHHPLIAKIARELAYKKGEINRLASLEATLIVELAEVRAQKLSAELAAQTFSDKLQQYDLDSTDVRAIKAMPRKAGARHGAFINTLVHTLRGVSEPLKTSDILMHLQSIQNADFKLPNNQKDAMHRVARTLRILRDRGCVVRTDSGGIGAPASWLWVGDQPIDQESS